MTHQFFNSMAGLIYCGNDNTYIKTLNLQVPVCAICLHVQLCSSLKVCVHIQCPNTVPSIVDKSV